ncbi:LIC_12616 family protein [Pantoea vagans]|uniref:phage neck terminator protein n=1 Tax=Pantoea vagans TaxID=470934 RepID=UPI003018F85C
MSATISITQDDLTTALRGFLLSLVDAEVFLSQENNSPMPIGDFVTMTPMFITGLSTNRVAYNDPGTGQGSEQTQRSNQWRCQLDFYGNSAQEMAAIIGTMIRSEYASEWFRQNNMPVTPLYAGEPHQTTMINAEQQYENRWTLDFIAQFNAVISTPLEFMDSIQVGIVAADLKFPPENL